MSAFWLFSRSASHALMHMWCTWAQNQKRMSYDVLLKNDGQLFFLSSEKNPVFRAQGKLDVQAGLFRGLGAEAK